MTEILETASHILDQVVQICTLLIEIVGVIILIFTGIRTFIRWIRHEPDLRISLAKGISFALGVLMIGEALRTVVTRDLRELGILGGIIAVRVALTAMLQWEIRNEKKEMEDKEK